MFRCSDETSCRSLSYPDKTFRANANKTNLNTQFAPASKLIRIYAWAVIALLRLEVEVSTSLLDPDCCFRHALPQ
jgi:hypothetical protein